MDNRTKILIVDDEVVFLNSLKMSMPSQGYNVLTASNGLDALALINGVNSNIDLILTDYAMPGMNGIDLVKKVRKKYPQIPAILMTAHGQKTLILNALHSRFDGYIEKPFVSEKLFEEIRTVLYGRKKAKYPLGNGEDIDYHVHQINTPLTVITGSLCLANQNLNNLTDVKKYLQNIQDACRKIESINKKMLAQVKITHTQKESVNIKQLLRRCMKFMQSLLVSESIQVKLDIEAADVTIKADSYGLEQVFHNLILNAVEAMENRANKKIWVTAEYLTNRSLLLIFRDSGCGIPEDVKGKLFKPYFTSKAKGTGLGLALAKDVVEDLEGQISAKNLLGGGSVFTISIPC